jgi:hypothetical protein
MEICDCEGKVVAHRRVQLKDGAITADDQAAGPLALEPSKT